MRDPAWREAAWGPGGRRSDAASQMRMSELLARASQSVARIRGEDVLRGAPSDEVLNACTFRRRAGIGIGIEEGAEGGCRVVRVIASEGLGDRVTECEITADLAPVALWVASRRLSDRFRPEDIPSLTGVSVTDLAEFLGVLVAAGAVACE